MKKEVLIFLLIGLVAFSPVVDAFSFSEAFGNILDFFKDLFKRTVGSFILLTPSDVSAEKSGDNQIRVSWDYFTCDAGYPINSPPTITLISPTGRTTGVPDNSPPTITLISPLGAAASVSINPTLTWDGYDADGDNILYILYLKDSESTTWQTYPLQQETYTVQNLEFNTIYNWKVSVVAGTDTVVSDPRTYTTEEEVGVPDNSPPTITLISPLGAAASVSINPTLTWDGYDADGDNILYILYLKDSESTTWQTYPLQQETYTVQNLEFNTIYNWKVSVVAGTDTVVSDPRTFTTEEEVGVPDNSPPTITLISPLGAAASVSINPTLTWDGDDADRDYILYTLSLKKQTDLTWETYDTLLETYTVQESLNFNTAYDWKVSANDGTSTEVSNQRTFTTEEYNPEPCTNDDSVTRDCLTGDQDCPTGSQTRTCNNGVWSNWGSCIMDADNCEGANPHIQIAPTIISFESEVNIPQDQLFTISNTGDEALTIYDITLSERNYLSSDPPFEVITNIKVNNVPLDRSGFTYSLAQNLIIAPGNSKTVVLTFTPDAFGNAGTYDGKVYIYHSDEVHFNSHPYGGNDYISYVAYHGQGVENIEPFCGDGSIDSGEECDTANLGSQTCSLLGFNGGDLLGTDACQLDTSSCHSSEICDNGNPLTDSNGNGIISAFECSNYDYSLSIDELTPMDENVYSYAYTSFDCEYGI